MGTEACMWKPINWAVLGLGFFLSTLYTGCSNTTLQSTQLADRESLIPASQEKITPDSDLYPVTSFTREYKNPVPLPYPVNTAGVEDSAFITPDGSTLYVWFTPDASKPAEEQIVDGVTGIYVFQKTDEGWGKAERVLLQDPGKLALDGCEFVHEDVMLFCTVREGYTGIQWFSADFQDGRWRNWKPVEFDPAYEIGELHITADGSDLYFHSARPGGQGGLDIWVSENIAGEWQTPKNVASVNSPNSEGWPFISPDGSELWFTRTNGAPELYRSKQVNGEWAEPEKIFSHFSGEASMDNNGNIYFTHHFYKDDQILEADIYIAKKVLP